MPRLLRSLIALLAAASLSTGSIVFLDSARPTSDTNMAASPNEPSTSGSSSQSGMRPGAVPLDVDGYPVAPPELELEQVHLYVRHGV